MEQVSSLPKVAFVVNLAARHQDDAIAARGNHLVHLFSGHRLPATWTVDGAEQATQLQQQLASPIKNDLALRIASPAFRPNSSPAQFRAELRAQIAVLGAANGAALRLVVGDPQLLRPRASLLAEQGIRGIMPVMPERQAVAKPRPLSCGLWQLEPSFSVPVKRRLASLLRSACPSVKQLIAATPTETTLVQVQADEFGRTGARSLQGLEKMLREISWAASRDQLVVSTVGELLTTLASQRAVSPQRSILREAA